ncbi:hypothetical protein CPT32_10315 [Rhizobium sophoriradicis]|uniref:hypothetical protein n=1 Tax=Rhizobium sophoriradicis TaxID=1535245 RepID=UPI000BBDA494|nr:hypothetical protein [Rhizobium sophoriradicis]PCK86811.1 hypothetical protein CPT32_10315 [Rhizobium sophoriradicis]
MPSRLAALSFGLGTNAGLKPVGSGTEGVTYAELLHVNGRGTMGISAHQSVTLGLARTILIPHLTSCEGWQGAISIEAIGGDMGFKSIFDGLRDRIFARQRSVSADYDLSPHERLVRDYDLHLVELHDEIPYLIPQRDAMRAAWQRRDFVAYHEAFEAARQTGSIAENGKPLYRWSRNGSWTNS